MKTFWKRYRKQLAASPKVRGAMASLIASAIRFVDRTNRAAAGSHDPRQIIARHTPAIAALWHGQHLLGPTIQPRGYKIVAMFSRSADAELNALAAQKLGFDVVRGSGGRGSHDVSKGGARALITLKRVLDGGNSVAMIADVPHGTPREAGLGIVTLARLSGRPIVPVAIATSRRKVLDRTWDKTTLNLPFGRKAVAFGEPIFVPADADEAMIEAMRVKVTEALNAATREAYELADGA